MDAMYDILHNDVLMTAVLAWLVAQILKFIFHLLMHKKLDLTRFVGSGGMPSSHSAFVMGISTSVGLKLGFDSVEYAVALCFALVVMYDASGVRRAVGIQANIINKMINDLKEFKHIEEKSLKELVGHTPFEVFIGAFLGIIIANIII